MYSPLLSTRGRGSEEGAIEKGEEGKERTTEKKHLSRMTLAKEEEEERSRGLLQDLSASYRY